MGFSFCFFFVLFCRAVATNDATDSGEGEAKHIKDQLGM